VAFGSNHGNEYEGPCALKGLLHEINLDDVRGRIILVPVLNPSASSGHSREQTRRRRELESAFVDGAGVIRPVRITHRIAAFVRQSIWPRSTSCWIALGGRCRPVLAVCQLSSGRRPELSAKIEQTARWFGVPSVMIYQNATPDCYR